jgi:hypothetical protein
LRNRPDRRSRSRLGRGPWPPRGRWCRQSRSVRLAALPAWRSCCQSK